MSPRRLRDVTLDTGLLNRFSKPLCPGPPSTTSPALPACRRGRSPSPSTTGRASPRRPAPGSWRSLGSSAGRPAPGPRPLGVEGVRRRHGRGPASRDPARRRLLPVLHRRPRGRAVPPRARPAAPGRRARRRRDLPQAREGGPGGRGPDHRPAGRRPEAGAACRARDAGGGRRPRPRRRPPPGPRGRRRPRHPGGCCAPGGPRPSAYRTRRRTGRDGARAVPAPRLGAGPTRRRVAGRPVRRGGLLRGVRRACHRCAARPPRATDRDRLRQRPDGDGRALPRGLPWHRRSRPDLGHRVRRHGARRAPAAVPDHREHRRGGLGAGSGHQSPRAHRRAPAASGRPANRAPCRARVHRTPPT